MSEEKQRTKDRRYAAVSKETVQLFAESVGYANLPDEITETLAEDVNYKLRDIVQQSFELMKQTKRRKLTTNDFSLALKNCDTRPVYGHSFSDPLSLRQTKESEIFFYDDAEVNLTNIALSSDTPYQLRKSTVKATWIAVEGTRTGSSLPQSTSQGKSVDYGIRPLSEDLLLYYDMVTKAILGTDENLMKEALKNLRRNAKLAPLLPYLVNFVSNGVKTVSHDTSQLSRLLHTVKAIVTNPSFFLEPKPYLNELMQTILYCQVEPLAASINPSNDHWTLRDNAAHLLGYTMQKWQSPLYQLKEQNLVVFQEILADNSRPFCTHYGAVMGILAMGLEAVNEILIPLLPSCCNHLEESFKDSTYSNAIVKSDAQKVHGALLLVAEYIVRCHIDQLMMSDKLEKINCGISNDLDPPRQSFSDLYNQLYDYFGDSIAARLPIVYVHRFYLTKRERKTVVSFADADTCRSGDELLQQFLVTTREEMEADEKWNHSVHSSVHSSDENHSYVADDTDMTIKETVSDPSRGIKLTILKRPKSKQSDALLVPAASASASASADVSAGAGEKKKLKTSNPRATQRLIDVFEVKTLRDQDVIFVFKFQGRVQQCMFSERQKALILARDMAQQHAALSKYRTLCSRLMSHGKRMRPKRRNLIGFGLSEILL